MNLKESLTKYVYDYLNTPLTSGGFSISEFIMDNIDYPPMNSITNDTGGMFVYENVAPWLEDAAAGEVKLFKESLNNSPY